MKKAIWYTLLALSLAGILTMTTGLFRAYDITMSKGTPVVGKKTPSTEQGPGTGNMVTKAPNRINILTLGDSIAKGTGDEKRLGMDGNLKPLLSTVTSKEILLDNIAVDGQQSAGLLLQISGKQYEAQIQSADIILISIGGNNIRPLGLSTVTLQIKNFQPILNSYLSDLDKIFKRIRNVNPSANIVFTGLYYPFLKGGDPETLRLLNTWNAETQQYVESDPKSVFIPTYDLFKYHMQKYLFIDQLHPNSSGYQAIAQRIFQSMSGLFAMS